MTVKYGKSKSEKKAEKSLECRQIVQEIISYGVSQDQILQIIKLLALEIEDRNHLLQIVEVIENFRLEENKLIEP